MTLYFRKRLRLGRHIRVNLSRSGASTSFTLGGVTVNPRRRRTWVNLPGPFFWSGPTTRRRSR